MTTDYFTPAELRVSARHNLTDARTQAQLHWAAARIETLETELERTRQAWVNGDDPMCDDVCVVACKGPCGLFTGEPYDADDIREATVDGCRYCNGTGVRHEASNPEPCIHCGTDGREATTDAG